MIVVIAFLAVICSYSVIAPIWYGSEQYYAESDDRNI